MATLFRTQRPRFPRYVSDGNGRDYYIKFNNAGYWDEQYKVNKKPDYEYPKYNNYHSLFHHPAPVKYIPTGHGRETYIINSMGLYHDQKPLATYKLNDFLRDSKTIQRSFNKSNKKRYMSIGEKRYNYKLQSLEKEIVKRLYKIPMSLKKAKKKLENEEDNTLPNLGKKKEKEFNETNTSLNYNENSLDRDVRLNTIGNLPNHSSDNLKKKIFNFKGKEDIGMISVKNSFNTILSQSQDIEKYELTNKARKNNNETDYNIYKNGRMGCRIRELKELNNCSSELWKKSSKRIMTEGNQKRNNCFSLVKPLKTIKKNKLTFSFDTDTDKKLKTLEY